MHVVSRLLCHGLAGPIPDVLGETGEQVKDGGLADVRLSGKGDDHRVDLRVGLGRQSMGTAHPACAVMTAMLLHMGASVLCSLCLGEVDLDPPCLAASQRNLRAAHGHDDGAYAIVPRDPHLCTRREAQSCQPRHEPVSAVQLTSNPCSPEVNLASGTIHYPTSRCIEKV